jgi:hypothetical protein
MYSTGFGKSRTDVVDLFAGAVMSNEVELGTAKSLLKVLKINS